MRFSILKEKIEVGVEDAELRTQRALGKYPPLLRWSLIICLLAFLPLYFIAKSASYSYWAKSYQGGILLAHTSFNSAKPPKLLDLSLTTTGNNNYAAVATIQNENLDLSAENFSYDFKFFDDKNNPILAFVGDSGGQSYLLPNQKQYLAVPKIITQQKIASVKLNFNQDFKWQKRLQLPDVKLSAGVPNFYQQLNPLAFVVEGRVQNQSPYHVKTVDLTFLAYDVNKKIVAISSRKEYDLEPLEQRAFKQLWPDVLGQNVVRVEVESQTNVLDPLNLKVPQTVPGSASDLSRPIPPGQ